MGYLYLISWRFCSTNYISINLRRMFIIFFDRISEEISAQNKYFGNPVSANPLQSDHSSLIFYNYSPISFCFPKRIRSNNSLFWILQYFDPVFFECLKTSKFKNTKPYLYRIIGRRSWVQNEINKININNSKIWYYKIRGSNNKMYDQIFPFIFI